MPHGKNLIVDFNSQKANNSKINIHTIMNNRSIGLPTF